MIIVIEGLAGSGKTWFAVRLAKKEWLKGRKIFPNFPLWFDTTGYIKRWHNLDETFNLTEGVLIIDESQKFLDARRWHSLPMTFTEKIAMHRHHHLDIITTTQDLGHIDIRMRQNVHELYKCQTIFRFPYNQSKKPILQLIKINRKMRNYNSDSGRVYWTNYGYTKYYFISKYFTKSYYNTYGDVGEHKFLCRILYKKKASEKRGKWQAKVYSKELVDRGRARL